MDLAVLQRTFITSFDAFELRMLEISDLSSIKGLDPGDLSWCQGEWLFPRGREAAFIEKWFQERLDGKGFRAGIFKGKVLVGIVGLSMKAPSMHDADMSYAMDSCYRHQGIMTKACREIIHFGFIRLHLKMIRIMADVDNQPSCALAERLGFKKEALISQAYQATESKRDAFLYVLTRAETN